MTLIDTRSFCEMNDSTADKFYKLVYFLSIFRPEIETIEISYCGETTPLYLSSVKNLVNYVLLSK